LQYRALHPLTVLPTTEAMCDSKQTIAIVASPGMHNALRQGAPLQLQQLAAQLDAVLASTYKALGLAICILAATAGSLGELQAAEKRFAQERIAMQKLARSLRRSDANAAAAQHVKYLEHVVAKLLERKQELLGKLHSSQQLLQQAAAAAAQPCSQQDKQQLAAAMGAVTRAHDAEVRFGQLPDGELFAIPGSVTVDFGAQLTGAAPQERHLRIINAASSPLQLQLLDDSGSSSSSGSGEDAGAAELAQVIQVHKRQLLISPGRAFELVIVAGTSSSAGKATAQFLLAIPASSGCAPVAVAVQAEYQQLSVTVDTAAVDFGMVPCYKKSVKHVLRVSNNTGVAVHLKSRVHVQHGVKSAFSVEPDVFVLQPYKSSRPINLRMQPSSSSETIRDAKLLIAAGGAESVHEVSVSAEVQQPVWSLRMPGGQQVGQHTVVPVVPLQPGQLELLEFQLENQGGQSCNAVLCVASHACFLLSGQVARKRFEQTGKMPGCRPTGTVAVPTIRGSRARASCCVAASMLQALAQLQCLTRFCCPVITRRWHSAALRAVSRPLWQPQR
jgi:hypothetical protein